MPDSVMKFLQNNAALVLFIYFFLHSTLARWMKA